MTSRSVTALDRDVTGRSVTGLDRDVTGRSVTGLEMTSRNMTGLERDMTGREILTVNINQITTDLGAVFLKTMIVLWPVCVKRT